MSFPYVSIDCEMCGLDRKKHDILEFGAVLDDLSDPKPIESLPTFHCYFYQDMYTGHPFALSMHSEIFKRIASREPPFLYLSPMKFGYLFKQFLIKNGYKADHDVVTITAAGKNFGTSDLPFLEERTDISKHVSIRSRVLDPAVLFIEGIDETIPGTDLCRERMGIKGSTAHTSVADAIEVVQMIRFKLGNKFSTAF